MWRIQGKTKVVYEPQSSEDVISVPQNQQFISIIYLLHGEKIRIDIKVTSLQIISYFLWDISGKTYLYNI